MSNVPSNLVPTRITQLPVANVVNPGDTIPIVQGGQSKQASVALIQQATILQSVLTATPEPGMTNSRRLVGGTGISLLDNGSGSTLVVNIADNPTFPGNEFAFLPRGTTAQRPVSPQNGYVRYNTDLLAFEGYQNGVWATFASAAAVTQINTGAGLTGGPITSTGTISVDTNGITNSLFRQSAALSIVGNATNALANVSDIIAGSDGDVLRRSGTSIGFGTIPVSSVVGAVPDTIQVIAGVGLSGGGPLSTDVTLNLDNVIVAGGPTGDGSTVPVITYNAQGQLTAVTTAAITAASVGGLADPGSNGLVVRTAANITTARTLTGGLNIAVTNGDGTTGNPTIDFSGVLGLANGGTNASLTASLGGVVYSTATALAVLAGTATANQVLLSGASAAPAWSTATYPATSTINRLLYSSANNVISELATANTGALVTSSTGVPSIATGAANRVLRSDGTTVSFAQVALATDVSGILPGANGGTNNGFMQFSGPATSLKTFTLPNASETIATLGQVQTFTAAQRGSISALTDGATITPDFAVANNFSVTISGSRTLANPTNLTAGQSGAIWIVQDGTGGYSMSYGSYWDFSGGAAPSINTSANAVNVLVYAVRSTTSISASIISGLS